MRWSSRSLDTGKKDSLQRTEWDSLIGRLTTLSTSGKTTKKSKGSTKVTFKVMTSGGGKENAFGRL